MKLTKAKLKQIIREELENLNFSTDEEMSLDDFMNTRIGDETMTEVADYAFYHWLINMGITNGQILAVAVGLPLALAATALARPFVLSMLNRSRNSKAAAQREANKAWRAAAADQKEADLEKLVELLFKDPKFPAVAKELMAAEKTGTGTRSAARKFNALVRTAAEGVDTDSEKMVAAVRQKHSRGELESPEQSIEENRLRRLAGAPRKA